MSRRVKRMVARKCRVCINSQFHVNLEQTDCRYFPYPAACISCGQMRNIVTDIRFLSRWQFWFKKTKAVKAENPLKRRARLQDPESLT